jgi:hypothetical protein
VHHAGDLVHVVARRLDGLIKVCHPSETEDPPGFLVRNFDRVHNQFRRSADDACFCQDVTIGRRPDVASANLDADRYRLGQIDLPTGVQTSGSFCQDHTDSPVQQTHRLTSAIGHWHSKNDPLGIGRKDFDPKGFRRSLRKHRAQLFNGSHSGRKDRHRKTEIEELTLNVEQSTPP